MIEFSFAQSRRRRFSVKTRITTGALELWISVMSSGRVVLDEILHGTLSMVLHGSRPVYFQLSALFNYEYLVLRCKQEVQTPRSRDQPDVLWVRTVRFDRVPRVIVRANNAGVKHLVEAVHRFG